MARHYSIRFLFPEKFKNHFVILLSIDLFFFIKKKILLQTVKFPKKFNLKQKY